MHYYRLMLSHSVFGLALGLVLGPTPRLTLHSTPHLITTIALLKAGADRYVKNRACLKNNAELAHQYGQCPPLQHQYVRFGILLNNVPLLQLPLPFLLQAELE